MKTTRLDTFNNDQYQPGSKLKIALWMLVSRIFFQTSLPYPSLIKVTLLRSFGAKIGTGVVLKPNITIKYPWFLTIGDHTWLGEGCWIDNLDKVSIGSHVCISQGAMLLSGNHDYKSAAFDLLLKPIVIHDGAWIGAKAVVTQGVVVGSHAVLTVGSVTSKNLDSYKIYAGNPALVIRNRVIV